MGEKIGADSAVFKKALAVISASGAQFKIIMPGGEEFGTLVVEQERKVKRRRLHSWGALRDHIGPHLDALMPGGYAEIPAGPFELHVVSKAASSRGVAKWGNGSVVVAQNPERKVVEVLRLEAVASEEPTEA
jgi:hypothetical protein